MVVTAISFTPQQWMPFVAGNLMIGLIYGSIGALAGVALGRVGATYFMLFLAMVDLGIAQTPMFGSRLWSREGSGGRILLAQLPRRA